MDRHRNPPEPDASLQASSDAASDPQALLERVIAQFPAAAAVYAGPQHVFRAVSAAYKEVIGGRDVIGLPIREALPWLDGQGFFELLDRVYATGEPITMSGVPATWDTDGDGEAKPRTVDFTYQALFTPGGEIEGVIVLVQDVSDRHAAQSRDRVLARLGAEMSVAGDERVALQHLADVAVSELADWVVVDVIGIDGRTAQRVAMAHADGAKAQVMRELAERYPPDPSRPTLAREALASGQAQLYSDVDDAFIASVARDAEQARLARLVGARSAMVVPLQTRAGPFGVVAFGSGRRAFTRDDLAVAEELGRRASLAVENARLVAAARHATEEAQLAAGRTARLQTLSAALASALTPNDVAVTAVREAVAAIGADAGLLALLSPDGASLDVIETVGYDGQSVAAWRRFPVETNVPLADAVRSGEIVTLVSHDDRSRRYPKLDGGRPIRYPASISVPLMAEGRSFGALGLSFRAPITVLPEDRELLLAVARQCAQAVRRATLFDAEAVARAAAETAGGRFAFLSDASAVLASLDYEVALQRVARLAVPVFADYVAIDVVDDAGVLQRVGYAHGDPACETRLCTMARHHPRVGEASHPRHAEMSTDGPILVEEVTRDWVERFTSNPDYAADAWALGPRSMIIAPLRSRGKTLGAMTFVVADSGRRYAATDVAVAAEVARRAATAVDNARLYQQSEAARREAEAASRAKGQFLAVMSHELRTPLNAILGYTELVEMGVHGPVTDAQREAMARIHRSGRHLLALVNNVLNLERAEVVGAMEPVLASLAVAQLFEDADALSRVQAEAKGLTLTVVPPPPDVMVVGEREQVSQILANLLSNAVKFTPPGGEVTLSCEPDGEVARLRVRDTGVGIPAEALERAFEPFVQLDTGLTRRAEGAGLGLAISRRLARLMGGDVVAESTIGAGSTFTLTLRLQ